jgi:ubiquinone/menaquinone biosynthesis C-methylase UbiE
VLAYYDRGLEEGRLAEGKGGLERARTEELLARFLPAAPAVVLDVGGGTGHYAAWLAMRGYVVHLIEPVPLHIELARARSAAQADAPLASIVEGDARRLEWPDNSVDTVLLLGPLYHLVTFAERLECLREAWRVLRPGGTLIVVVISRFASMLDGLVSHLFEDPRFEPIAWEDIERGRHHGIGDKYFTLAYLHRPDEIEHELRQAGFGEIQLLAVEGPGWLLQDFDTQWADTRSRAIILEAAQRTERERSLIGASSHLMAIGYKN